MDELQEASRLAQQLVGEYTYELDADRIRALKSVISDAGRVIGAA